MSTNPLWLLVPGGTCRFGDSEKPVAIPSLYWTATLVTRGMAGGANDFDAFPVTNISQTDAVAIGTLLGGRLPRSSEWEWMAAGPERRTFPWGFKSWNVEFANLKASSLQRTVAVGQFPKGSTPEGILDVAGNVWEWTASLTPGDGAVIRGGSYKSVELHAKTTFINIAPVELRSAGIGVRLVKDA